MADVPAASVPLDHSIVSDLAFVKLAEIRHAESCSKMMCTLPSCFATKFLVKHVEQCVKAACKYLDCGYAQVILAHARNQQHNSPTCPICQKQDVIRRLHPGKGPREVEEDEEGMKEELEKDEEVKKVPPLRIRLSEAQQRIIHVKQSEKQQSSDGGHGQKRKLEKQDDLANEGGIEKVPPLRIRLSPAQRQRFLQTLKSDKQNSENITQGLKRRIVTDPTPETAESMKTEQDEKSDSEDIIIDELAMSRARMAQILHSQSCNWDYCCKNCYWTKQLLAHIKQCATPDCNRAGCEASKDILMHYKNCRPHDKQCEICSKMPDPASRDLYRGTDHFEDLNSDVLRRICGLLDEPTLNALQYVNTRVYRFFQYPGEIKKFYPNRPQKVITELRIEQLCEGSTFFHFNQMKAGLDGYMHVIGSNGKDERLRYKKEKRLKALLYIKTKYGRIKHSKPAKKHKPTALSPSFYNALSLALQKYSFCKLFVGSILLDDDFRDFFMNKKNKAGCFLGKRTMKAVNSPELIQL